MITDFSGNDLNQLTTTVATNPQAVTGCTVEWPNQWPYNFGQYQPVTQWFATAPQECSGDVHVFPCPHCDKCKCGKATVAKAKKAKR